MWIAYFVMENGMLSRIYILVLVGALIQILENKTIQAFYNRHDPETWLQCSRCDPKSNSILNPLQMWDSFPCPPASDPDLLLDLDWITKLGPSDGAVIKQRVAARCGITIPQVAGPESGYVESYFEISNCDINCILVVLAVVVCIVVLTIPAVVCCVKRRNVFKWMSKRTLHSSARNSPLCRDGLYPPLSSAVTRDSEIIYNADGAQTRLLQTKEEQAVPVSPYRYYEKVFSDKDFIEADPDVNTSLQKNSSEETSLTYSGTETTHTYESLKDGQGRQSYRLSRSSGKSDYIPMDDVEQYNSSMASGSQGQRSCGCPNCSRTNIYRPYESIDYNSMSNASQLKARYAYNRPPHRQSSSPSPRSPYQEQTLFSNEVIDGSQNTPPYYGSDVNDEFQGQRTRCTCRKCSHANSRRNMTSPTRYSESEVYGIPYQNQMNMTPLRPCGCPRCTQNMAYHYYNSRLPCNCKRCLQNLQPINQTIEAYSYDQNSDMNKQEQESLTKRNKKKKHRMGRQPSSNSLSVDESESSVRLKSPKTNGSLYMSKISKI